MKNTCSNTYMKFLVYSNVIGCQLLMEETIYTLIDDVASIRVDHYS